MAHETVAVSLGSRSYNILIGEGLLKEAGRHIAPLLKRKRAFILTDEHVAALYLKLLQDALQQEGITSHPVTLPAGEGSKSFASLERALDSIFALQPERSDTLIALGGGVIGDLTGFAASILLRGIHFIQIPTTLLAQVDSSVGGKTGINNRFGKNLVGTFYQPKLVLADTSVLASLPEREYLSGYAEIAKYGLINDEPFFAWLEANTEALKTHHAETIRQAVKHSCMAKAAIVAEDEKEGGARALLNLGHTFAHALESETGYSNTLLHGEAVGIGMVLAFRLSEKLGLTTPKDTSRILTHFKAMGMYTSMPEIRATWNAEKLLHHMYQDKKVSGGRLVFILAKGIGKSFIAKDIESSVVLETLNEALTKAA